MSHPKPSPEMAALREPQPNISELHPSPTTQHAESEGRRKLVFGGKLSYASEINIKDYPEWVRVRARLATLESQHLEWVDKIVAANDSEYSRLKDAA